QQHVPWTRIVDEEVGERIRHNRHRFVLKPNDEYGGTGVTLGWETTETEWEGAIARALRESQRGWIAQERITVRRELFPIRDRVALIADEPSREVAASLAAALDEAGASTETILLEQVARRPLGAALSVVLEALDRSDAGILCVQPQQGELGARMAIVAAVERRQ